MLRRFLQHNLDYCKYFKMLGFPIPLLTQLFQHCYPTVGLQNEQKRNQLEELRKFGAQFKVRVFLFLHLGFWYVAVIFGHICLPHVYFLQVAAQLLPRSNIGPFPAQRASWRESEGQATRGIGRNRRYMWSAWWIPQAQPRSVRGQQQGGEGALWRHGTSDPDSQPSW